MCDRETAAVVGSDSSFQFQLYSVVLGSRKCFSVVVKNRIQLPEFLVKPQYHGSIVPISVGLERMN